MSLDVENFGPIRGNYIPFSRVDRIVGPKKTAKLCEEFPGRHVSFKKVAPRDDPIRQIIGDVLYKKLLERVGYGKTRIPKNNITERIEYRLVIGPYRPGDIPFTELSTVIGPEKSALVCAAFGGLENIYIPKSPNPDHPLRVCLGDKIYRRMLREIGFGKVDVPKRPAVARTKKSEVIDAILAGELYTRDIAIKHKVTTRWVRQVRANLRALGVDVPELRRKKQSEAAPA